MRYIILISFLLFSCTATAQDTITGIPTITDGDTIKIDKVKIRLHGIDAPELNQSCKKAGRSYQCGSESKKFLINLIGNDEVTCKVLDTDRYKRLVAKCFTSNGIDINASFWATSSGWRKSKR